jgi:hypothetical protein
VTIIVTVTGTLAGACVGSGDGEGLLVVDWSIREIVDVRVAEGAIVKPLLSNVRVVRTTVGER